MSNNYGDLGDVSDGFNFSLRGNKYFMRYPIVEEVEKVQELSSKIKELEDSKDEADKESVKNFSKELEEYLYDFISPVDHDQSIREALKKENIIVMRNFNKMLTTELSLT